MNSKSPQLLPPSSTPKSPPWSWAVSSLTGREVGAFSQRAGILLLVLTVSGCSSTTFQDPDVKMRRELSQLQESLLGLQKKSVVAEVEILRLREKVAELEAAAARAATEAASRPAPQPVFERPRPDTAQPVTAAPLPPPIETTDLESDEAWQGDDSAQPGSTTSLPASTEVSESPPGADPEPNDAEPVPMAAQALYDRGFTEYHEGRYLEAEASLQQFLEGFPDSEWSDNALYWIGEARYARRDYRGALASFRETVNRFPLGNKVPDALLKSGQSLEQLGDLASARQSYREVLRRFPETATALIAQERLQQLDG